MCKTAHGAVGGTEGIEKHLIFVSGGGGGSGDSTCSFGYLFIYTWPIEWHWRFAEAGCLFSPCYLPTYLIGRLDL